MWPSFVPLIKVVQSEKVVQLFFEKSLCNEILYKEVSFRTGEADSVTHLDN